MILQILLSFIVGIFAENILLISMLVTFSQNLILKHNIIQKDFYPNLTTLVRTRLLFRASEVLLPSLGMFLCKAEVHSIMTSSFLFCAFCVHIWKEKKAYIKVGSP